MRNVTGAGTEEAEPKNGTKKVSPSREPKGKPDRKAREVVPPKDRLHNGGCAGNQRTQLERMMRDVPRGWRARSAGKDDYTTRSARRCVENMLRTPGLSGNPEAVFDVDQLPSGEGSRSPQASSASRARRRDRAGIRRSVRCRSGTKELFRTDTGNEVQAARRGLSEQNACFMRPDPLFAIIAINGNNKPVQALANIAAAVACSPRFPARPRRTVDRNHRHRRERFPVAIRCS